MPSAPLTLLLASASPARRAPAGGRGRPPRAGVVGRRGCGLASAQEVAARWPRGRTWPSCWPGPRPRTSSPCRGGRRVRRDGRGPAARHPRARLRLGARARRRGPRQAGRRGRGGAPGGAGCAGVPGCCTPGTGWSTCATASRRHRARLVGATASTVVHFADLDDAEVEAYVATGEPLRVAGAFTLDGLGGPTSRASRATRATSSASQPAAAARAAARARRRWTTCAAPSSRRE